MSCLIMRTLTQCSLLNAVFLAAAALTHRAVSAGSEHFDLSKVLLELRFQPCGQMCMLGLCHA